MEYLLFNVKSLIFSKIKLTFTIPIESLPHPLSPYTVNTRLKEPVALKITLKPVI
jgi:hypothetical protein